MNLHKYFIVLMFLMQGFSCTQQKSQPNFIFIIIDDQNMELSCFGKDYIKTPNLDRLSSEGIRFSHAYVQQAVCAASRASFLTGLHPRSTGVEYPYSYYFAEEIIHKSGTIGKHFLENGYDARYFGQVHHGVDEKLEVPNYYPGGTRYVDPENIEIDRTLGNLGVPPYEKYDGPDTLFKDGRIAEAALKALSEWDGSRPFFYVVGFQKPHLPFSAPEKYWQQYNQEAIPLVKNPGRPIGFPEIAKSRYNLKQYKWEHSDPDSLFSDNYAQLLRQAYFACTSFVDAQIGKLIDEVERLGISEETYFVYLSDHGFHLGEQNHWGKTTLYESSLNSPLIISRRGMENEGAICESLVEYVDILPTVLELAGAEIPAHMEGVSTVPLLRDPEMEFKKAVFSRQERDIIGRRKGYSVRNNQFRYTEWHDHEAGTIVAKELYDLTIDPLEMDNLAIDTENNILIVGVLKVCQGGKYGMKYMEVRSLKDGEKLWNAVF
jgi:arylsulfatase A-like enzyme